MKMMPFSVRVEPKGDRSHQVTVAGALDAHTFEKFFNALRELVDAGALWIVLDFREMNYIGSVGINFLVNLRLQRKKAGGEVIMVKPQPAVRNVLELIGVLPALVVADSLEAAWSQIDSLKPPPVN